MRRLSFIFTMLVFSLSLMAQEKTPFNGIVTDAQEKPLKNLHIWTKREKDFASSDSKGRFGLTNVEADDTLHIRVKKNVYLIPVNGRKSLRIRLTDEKDVKAEEDQQLVDIGFGFVSRREHTGVSNYISGDDLRHSGYHDVLSALQGRIPGLNITGNSSHGGENQQVSMRGTSSFTADQTPLYVIDSMVVPNFDGLNLNEVKYVEVMKEASIYGSDGGNGAIIVHTK